MRGIEASTSPTSCVHLAAASGCSGSVNKGQEGIHLLPPASGREEAQITHRHRNRRLHIDEPLMIIFTLGGNPTRAQPVTGEMSK